MGSTAVEAANHTGVLGNMSVGSSLHIFVGCKCIFFFGWGLARVPKVSYYNFSQDYSFFQYEIRPGAQVATTMSPLGRNTASCGCL